MHYEGLNVNRKQWFWSISKVEFGFDFDPQEHEYVGMSI